MRTNKIAHCIFLDQYAPDIHHNLIFLYYYYILINFEFFVNCRYLNLNHILLNFLNLIPFLCNY